MKYFYGRVSTSGQNLDRQIKAAEEWEEENGKFDRIYVDKCSGKDFKRESWNELVENLEKGDLVVVLDLDRIGRNYDEVPEQWRIVTKEKEADILVLNMPLLDTRKSGGDLTQRFIADLVLQVLVYVADNERRTLKERQREGFDAMPVKNGRRYSAKTGNPCGQESYITSEWQLPGESVREAAARMGIPANTLYQRIKRARKKANNTQSE